MTTVQPESGLTLRVSRRFAASRERVFAAWTDPASMRQWFAPKGMTIPELEMDVRVGGTYRMAMQGADGDPSVAVGTFREINPPERLVFTWDWEGDAEFPETLVTVEFHERSDGTEIVLTHEGLPSEESRSGHKDGWASILERFDEQV